MPACLGAEHTYCMEHMLVCTVQQYVSKAASVRSCKWKVPTSLPGTLEGQTSA